MTDLTLIIPAKNESESLPQVLDELENYSYQKRIILHEDDKDTIASIKSNAHEIIYQKGKGYGNALITGVNSIKTKYFCIFNADGSFNPSEIEKMINKLENNNLDFIFASRYEKNSGSEDDTFLTYIGNKIFSLIGKLFFGLNISDILYTFVLGKTKNCKDLNLKSQDFRFCVELPIKAKRKKMKLSTSNSFERKRIAGIKKVNEFADGFKILIYLVKIFIDRRV
jgi:glycosyltransferase involved in cell wall biosynthesis